MKKYTLYILFALLSFMAESCGNPEFSNAPCYFVFDNSVAQNPVLASAMNASSPGIFCTVARSANGAQFVFVSNAGLQQASNLTAIDKKRTLVLGLNNGLILGYGTFPDAVGNMTFYAYDRECPNCFEPNKIPVKSRPLSLSQDGMATCSVCHRQYNMNTGGNVVKGDAGKQLTRYHALTTGPYTTVVVN